MLNNPGTPPEEPTVQVIEYGDEIIAERMASGKMNTSDEQLLENIRYAVKQGHPQMRTGPLQTQPVVLVGSGPSLNTPGILEELRQLVWEGAALVTLNGAYHWCIERNLRPNTQIVMDARPFNARFVDPDVPHCRYVLASTCDRAVWDVVRGRDEVWVWHPYLQEEGPLKDYLDRAYLNNWISVVGGTTVASRAVNLLRMVGYVRFEIFGVDCCYIGKKHHAIEQPENPDPWIPMRIGDASRPETERTFRLTTWHLKQLEDFLAMMKINGEHYFLNFHGDGALAYIVRTLGSHVEDATVRPDSVDVHEGDR